MAQPIVEEDMKLSEMFDTVMSNLDFIENTTESSNSIAVQVRSKNFFDVWLFYHVILHLFTSGKLLLCGMLS